MKSEAFYKLSKELQGSFIQQLKMEYPWLSEGTTLEDLYDKNEKFLIHINRLFIKRVLLGVAFVFAVFLFFLSGYGELRGLTDNTFIGFVLNLIILVAFLVLCVLNIYFQLYLHQTMKIQYAGICTARDIMENIPKLLMSVYGESGVYKNGK